MDGRGGPGTNDGRLSRNTVGPRYREYMDQRPKLQLSEAEWRQRLTPAEFHVLREGGTEPAFRGEYTETKAEGVYQCRACGAELFRSTEKFESHCGWPSFYKSLYNKAIEYIEDRSHGMVRTEVRCAKCGGHLGHLFDDAPQTPTGNRYCINSVSITFKAEE